MHDLRKRLERLEARFERSLNHTDLVFSTQREIIDKAFDQVRLALMEQGASLRALGAATKDGFEEFRHVLDDLERRVGSLEEPPAA